MNQYKLIKLQDKYILVSDEEITPADGSMVFWNNKILSNKISSFTGVDYSQCKKIIAGIPGYPQIDFSTLSEEDCKKIGYVDDIKKSVEYRNKLSNEGKSNWEAFIGSIGFLEGFKIAQSLNDKMFSTEDIKKIIHWSTLDKDVRLTESEFLQSLQEPKIWNVEIEMEKVYEDVLEGSEFILRPAGKRPKITNNSIKLIKIL